jgi:hypothetical protein
MIARFAWLSVLLGACGHHFEMEHPNDFVEIDEGYSSYDERAASAHGVVLGAREVENDPEGNLQFWVDAIKNRLRMNGGYALVEELDVTAATGERGKQLRFGRDQNGIPFVYWLTVFVTDDYIHLVEAGGREEQFREAEERVVAAINAFEID